MKNLYLNEQRQRSLKVPSGLGSLVSLIMILSFSGIMAQSYPPSHDPATMIRNTDGRYWIFTTGQGIWAMSSSNSSFTDWQVEPTPFPANSWPSWISNYVTGFTGSFWAPDVIKIGSYYYLYYSCAGQGAPAAIGVTRATNLAGPWTDLGMVVASNNAIDPALYMDGNRLWMTWGNWQTGIDICELNPSTGKRLNSTTTKLVTGQVEGPALLRNGSYYYLFYQRGLCCNGVNSTYYVVVARSTSITGPYTGERTFLPNQNGRFIGPGHIGYGEEKLTYHFYDGNDNGNAKLMITTLGWSNGWPVAGGTSPSDLLVTEGTYRIIPRHSGKAVDVQSCGTANGTNVQQWSWLNNNCQKWVFTDTGSGNWRISPLSSTGMALDVNGCSTSNNANVQLWSWLNNNCQKWQLVDMGNGYYQIKSLNSGKCLDVSGNSTADGANIVQYTCNSSSYNQQFSLQSSSGSRLSDLSESLSEAGVEFVMVYPNPAEDRFTVKVPTHDGPTHLRVINTAGQEVLNLNFEGTETEVNISELCSGFYIVQLEIRDGQITQKIRKN